MFNPQRPAPEQRPNSVSLTRKQVRPVRIVLHNQNAAGQRFRLSDCISANLFLGARCVVIEWLWVLPHFCLISFYEQHLGTRDLNRITSVYIGMAMGLRKKRVRQEGLWTPPAALPMSASHPFYERLNQILDEKKFDGYVETICEVFYAGEVGRPGLSPGIYFRLLMVGYFEGIDSERGIAWRASDSLSIRTFVRIALDESVPDHSTISRTRRLMDVETHQAVFQWVLQILAEKKLLKGTTIGVDATTLEANAALRSIVRRDTGERYEEFLTRLAKESGIETPTREQLAKLDRKRPKKGSNDDWTHPHDPDARITKMKDGRTHLAPKAAHAVDMETGAIVDVPLHGADQGDTKTIQETVAEAGERITSVVADTDKDEVVLQVSAEGPRELVTDKGYHSRAVVTQMAEWGVRTYCSEPDRGRQRWPGLQHK